MDRQLKKQLHGNFHVPLIVVFHVQKSVHLRKKVSIFLMVKPVSRSEILWAKQGFANEFAGLNKSLGLIH